MSAATFCLGADFYNEMHGLIVGLARGIAEVKTAAGEQCHSIVSAQHRYGFKPSQP